MASHKAKEPSTAILYQNANAAATEAKKITPEEQRVLDRNNHLWDIYVGNSPFNINDPMLGLNANLSLYKNASQVDAKRRVGGGLAANFGEGANSRQQQAVNDQNRWEADLMRRGALEDAALQPFEGLEARIMGHAQTAENRANAFADRSFNFYQSKASQPQKPKWYEQLLGGAASVGAAWAGAGFAV